jgi:hypothetical protein
MGVNERRKIQELQETTFPARTAELAEICGGGNITYEVDWDSFADDLEALNFFDNLSCNIVNMALRVICADDLGKGAVRDGLKLIKLKNVKTLPEKLISFKDGVLEMHCVYSLHGDGTFYDDEIRHVLEEGL